MGQSERDHIEQEVEIATRELREDYSRRLNEADARYQQALELLANQKKLSPPQPTFVEAHTKIREAEQAAFYAGIAAAVANIAREQGEEDLALHCLNSLGIGLHSFMNIKIDRFDMEVLERVYKTK